MTLTIKDALHSHKTTAAYQLEAIEEMDQCGQVDIINCIDHKIESIAERMHELDAEIEATGDPNDSIREQFYKELRQLGYWTLARQAATAVRKHEPELTKAYLQERKKNRELQEAVDRLENAHQETADELNALHTDVGDALETVKEDKEYIKEMEAHNSDLRDQVNDRNQIIRKMEKNVADNKAEITKLEEQNFELCEQLKQIKELLQSNEIQKMINY